MSNQHVCDIEVDDEVIDTPSAFNSEPSLSKKLERRRRIEDIFEKKRLQDEFDEFDLGGL